MTKSCDSAVLMSLIMGQSGSVLAERSTSRIASYVTIFDAHAVHALYPRAWISDDSVTM